jgi:hypothetical protein
MDCFLLQDWLTIQGTASSVFTQPENGWLDLTRYVDVVGWLEVKATNNVASFAYQTSPTMDDSLFVAPAASFAPAAGLTVTPVLKVTAVVPLGRWFRWRVTGSSGSGWSFTFRSFVAANRIGNRGTFSTEVTAGASNCCCNGNTGCNNNLETAAVPPQSRSGGKGMNPWYIGPAAGGGFDSGVKLRGIYQNPHQILPQVQDPNAST